MTALAIVSCAHKPHEVELSSSHWGNPAFSGTVETISSLEKSRASLTSWRRHAESEEVIVNESQLIDAIGLNTARFSISRDDAIAWMRENSDVRLFRFSGLYYVLVFFNNSGRSACVARHLAL